MLPEQGTKVSFFSRRRLIGATGVTAVVSLGVNLLGRGVDKRPDAKSVSGWTTRRGANVIDYGAIGDGRADDSAAFQSAVNAAVASRTPLIIPAPPVGGHWRLARTIYVRSDSGRALLDVHADGDTTGIQWHGGDDQVVLKFEGHVASVVQGLKLYIPHASGVVAFDIDTTERAQSDSQVTFKNCWVGLGRGARNIGWRLGHNSRGGADISFYQWENCFVVADAARVDTRGWLVEGPNTLHLVWFGGGGYYLGKMFSNRSDAGARTAQGGGSNYFHSLGGSHNICDFELANAGTTNIAGGRFEVGGRFLDVVAGAYHLAVTCTSCDVASYEPSDGTLINFDAFGTLLMDGFRSNGNQAVWSASMIRLGGRFIDGRGFFSMRGGAVYAEDRFWLDDADKWTVDLVGVGLMNSSGQTMRQQTYRAVNAGSAQ